MQWFFGNTLAWILLCALALAEYGNYQNGKRVDALCDLTGPHDFEVARPFTAREQINNICLSRGDSDDSSSDGANDP
jgi:hypothetical protein